MYKQFAGESFDSQTNPEIYIYMHMILTYEMEIT